MRQYLIYLKLIEYYCLENLLYINFFMNFNI